MIEMGTRIYVALPIDSIPDVDINERIEYSKLIRAYLLNFYNEVVTPFDGEWREGLPRHEYLRMGYKALLGCDAIFMCLGWEKSEGCVREFLLAQWCGMEILFGK